MFVEKNQLRARRRRLRRRNAVPAAVVAVPLVAEGVEARRGFLAFAWSVAVGLLAGARLVRLVGPGERPLERYEFENPEHRFPRLM